MKITFDQNLVNFLPENDDLVDEGYDLSEYTWDDMERMFSEGMHRDAKTGEVVDKAEVGKTYYPNMPKQKSSVAIRKEKEAKSMKEHVCQYLMDEGYTNNEVSAEVLYNHMSDEWLNSVVNNIEEAMRPGERQRKMAAKVHDPYIKGGSKSRGQAHNIAVRGPVRPGDPDIKSRGGGGVKKDRGMGYGDRGAGNKARRRMGLEPLRGSNRPG